MLFRRAVQLPVCGKHWAEVASGAAEPGAEHEYVQDCGRVMHNSLGCSVRRGVLHWRSDLHPESAGITLQFAQAQAGFSVVIDRQDAPNSSWTRVSGPIGGTTASDYPPANKAQVRYRIAYAGSNGETGEPSGAIAVPTGGSAVTVPA